MIYKEYLIVISLQSTPNWCPVYPSWEPDVAFFTCVHPIWPRSYNWPCRLLLALFLCSLVCLHQCIYANQHHDNTFTDYPYRLSLACAINLTVLYMICINYSFGLAAVDCLWFRSWRKGLSNVNEMVLYNIFWRRDDLACVHMYMCMPQTQRNRFNLFVITHKPYFDIPPSLIFRFNWHDEYTITFDLEIICIRKVSYQTIIQMFAHKVERHHWNLAIPPICWCLPNNKENSS